MPAGHWQAYAVQQNREAAPGLIVYFFGSGLYFANAVRFTDEIVRLVDEAQPQVQWLAVEAAPMIDIDYSGADTIRQVHTILQKKGVTLVLVNVIDHVRQELDRYGLTKLIGEDHLYTSLPDKLAAYRKKTASGVGDASSEESPEA
jgi:sulfate permease, SulP family